MSLDSTLDDTGAEAQRPPMAVRTTQRLHVKTERRVPAVLPRDRRV
jgi:hypothetical protein